LALRSTGKPPSAASGPNPKGRRWINRFISSDGFEENAYLFGDAASRECVLIDPGASAERVIAYVESEDLSVMAILATHAHIDHVVSAPILSRRFGTPFLVHAQDEGLLDGLAQQAASFGYKLMEKVKADGFFQEGTVFHVGSLSLQVLHTPGHTPGSSCFMSGGDLFTGDTLFAGSIGRTDFPGGSTSEMTRSLKRLASLPEALAIYPGHEGESTIGEEKATNPFLLSLYNAQDHG